MNNQQIKRLEALLDEREAYAVEFNNIADAVYYQGIIKAVNTIGYQVRIGADGKHTLVPM